MCAWRALVCIWKLVHFRAAGHLWMEDVAYGEWSGVEGICGAWV